MSNFADLADMLQQELRCTDNLLLTLQKERLLLEARDLTGMQGLLVEKSEGLNQLETLRHSRSQWLKQQGLPISYSELSMQLEKSLEAHAELSLELLTTGREKTDKCNYYNELNGILIANSRKRNSRQLDLMRGISREQKLYNASGGTESRTSQNNVGRA